MGVEFGVGDQVQRVIPEHRDGRKTVPARRVSGKVTRVSPGGTRLKVRVRDTIQTWQASTAEKVSTQP